MNKIQKIAFYTLVLTTILLSWDLIYGNIAIGISTAFALFYIVKEKKYKQLISLKILSTAFLFFVYLFGVFYSTDTNYGFTFAGRTITLLLFPLIFIGITLSKKQVYTIVIAFISSYTLRSVYALFTIGVKMYTSGIDKTWYFQEINNLGGFQPAYMGLYSVISMILLLFLFAKKKAISTILETKKTDLYSSKYSYIKILYVSVFIFHLFFLVILATRMAFIALLFIVFIYAVYILRKNKEKRVIIVTIGVLFILVTSLLLSQNNGFKFKLKQLKNINGLQYNKYDASGVSSRIAKWNTAITIGKEHLFFGVGTGDLPEQMMKQFYKLDCLSCKVQKYNNPHNQYLDSFARNGVLGLVALLFLLGYTAYVAVKSKNIYYIMFVTVFVVTLIPECLLNREKGVEVLTFFNAFYLYYLKDE